MFVIGGISLNKFVHRWADHYQFNDTERQTVRGAVASINPTRGVFREGYGPPLGRQ